jgi:hypothetical protein
MSLLVMADLEMLVCDKTLFDTYDHHFYQRFSMIVEIDEAWVRTDNANWLFSEELINGLWGAYPWGAQIHKQTDLLTIFSNWLQHSDNKQIVKTLNLTGLNLIPDIHTNYANRDYPDLVFEWLNVLARNENIELSQMLIFSSADKPGQVILRDSTNHTSQTFSIIKNEQEWRAALAQGDLWLRICFKSSGYRRVEVKVDG